MLGSNAYGNGGKCGSVILGVCSFPGAQTELKPGPRARLVTLRLLKRPHVVECGSRIVTESAVPGVVVRKDQSVDHGLGSAGLGGFLSPIAVVRSDLFPKAYTLRHIVEKFPFGFGRDTVSWSRMKGGAREGVRQCRVTRNA